jgi:hypothetical protein
LATQEAKVIVTGDVGSVGVMADAAGAALVFLLLFWSFPLLLLRHAVASTSKADAATATDRSFPRVLIFR